MAVNARSIFFNPPAGQSSYIKLGTSGLNPTIKNLQEFTWMAWVKPDTSRTKTLVQRLYCERQGGTAANTIRFGVLAGKDRVRFELAQKDGRNKTNYDYVVNWDNKWHHIAFCANIQGSSPSYQLIFDGVKVADGTLRKDSGMDAITNTAPIGNTCYLGNVSYHASAGSEAFLTGNQWYGKVDEIAVFKTALSESAIQTYVASKNTYALGDPDLISYWQFDETSGTTTTDSDNGTWNGTLTLNGSASSTLRTTDRPFMGNAVLDTTAPAQPVFTSTTGVTTDGFIMTTTVPSDQTQSGQSGIWTQRMEYQVDDSSAMTSYTSYTVDLPFSTATSLSLAVNDLLPNKIYYWRARAIDEALNASAHWASPQSVTTLTAHATPRPVAGVSVSSITYDTFVVNIVPDPHDTDTSSGIIYSDPPNITIAGFKIDIATDSRFRNYVDGWKNKDVVSTMTPVTDLIDLTNYFVRVRQYTSDGTESISSSIVPVFTPSAPDLSKPLPVQAANATSVDARAATANWDASQDDVGVTGYYLDVATDAAFTTLLYNYIDVGNVTSYRVTGLTPDVQYYYRAWARDAAGNVSDEGTNSTFTTPIVGVEDGGTITVQFQAAADSFTDSASPTATHGGDNVVSITGNGSTTVREGWLRFDLAEVNTNFINATLNMYVVGHSPNTISVRVSNSVTFDEATLNHSNKPTVSTTATTFVGPPTNNTWASVDLTPYFTTAGVYTVRITQTSSGGEYQFATKEGAAGGSWYAPYLELEYDPNIMIKADQIITEAGPKVYHNYIKDPTASSAGTTQFTATANTTMTNDATGGVNGGRAMKLVMTSAATNPIGMYSNYDIPVQQGDVVSVSAYVKASGANGTSKIQIQGLNAGNSVVSTTTMTAIAKVEEHTPVVGYYSVTDPTVVKARVFFAGTQSTAQTLFYDRMVAEVQSLLTNPGLIVSVGAYYDGDTGGYSGFWGGTAHASTTTRYGASIDLLGTYLGDGNTNASAQAFFKRQGDIDWISPYQQVQMYGDSTLDNFYALIGPTIGQYNQIWNPSFEVNTTGYTAVTGGGSSSITRITTDAAYGAACCQVTTNATANAGIKSQRIYTGTYSSDTIHGRVMVKAPTGSTIKAVILAYNSSNTLIGTSPAVTGGNQILGNGQWQDPEVSYELPVGTYSYELQVLQSTAVAATWYVDGFMLSDGPHVNPYRDGTFEDAYFEGAEHNSVTSLFIIPATTYDVMVTFTDPDGVVDQSGTSTSMTSTYTTELPPDYRTVINETTNPIRIEATEDRIHFELDYFGDDPHDGDIDNSEQMWAKVTYKRNDLVAYTLTTHEIDTVNKKIIGNIENLTPGTLYDIRINIYDNDGVQGLLGDTKDFQARTSYYGQATNTPSFITFGGYLLHDETKGNAIKTFVTDHDAFGFPDRNLDIQEIPKADGAVELDALWGRKTINMSGIVYGDTRGETLAAVDSLKHGLLGRHKPLIINTFANLNRKYYATVSKLDIQEEGGVNYRHLTWKATFECADPFAYSSDTLTLGPTQVQLNNSELTFTNNGGLDTYPKLTISTKSSSRITVAILNVQTGERIISGLGMITDDVLTIDSAASSVKMNGVEIGYTGIFPKFQTGDNTLRFHADRGPTAANIYVTAQWLERYI